MTGYAIPLSVARASRSPLRRPRRDFAVTAGDEFTLALTVYEDDAGGAVVDLTGADATWTIYDGSGTAVVAISGVVDAPETGLIEAPFEATDTAGMAGRFSHSLHIAFSDGSAVALFGMVNIQPVYGEGAGGWVSSPSSGTGSLPFIELE